MPPLNSRSDDGLFQTTEKGVIWQFIPKYDLVFIESCMKSTGDYDKLLSTPIVRKGELFEDEARGPSDLPPLVKDMIDYEKYLRRLARREKGRNSIVSEGENHPKKLLYIAWMDENEISASHLDVKLLNDSDEANGTIVEKELVWDSADLVTPEHFEWEKA